MICRSIYGFGKECWQPVCIYIIETICRERISMLKIQKKNTCFRDTYKIFKYVFPIFFLNKPIFLPCIFYMNKSINIFKTKLQNIKFRHPNNQ